MRQEYLRQQQKRSKQRRQIIASVIVVALIVAVAFGFSGGSKKKTNTSASATTVAPTTTTSSTAPSAPPAFGKTACPAADGSSPATKTFADSFQKCFTDGKKYTATMETDVGTIKIDLAADQSPITANNFIALARSHFYDGLTCHRVIKGFVDQCGDPKGDGSGGPGYTIGEEPPKSGKYAVGQLAMAKTSAPHTTGSQFFIIVGDHGAALPPQYSYLGTITEGLDAAKKIEADGAAQDPSPPAVVHKITKVTITES